MRIYSIFGEKNGLIVKPKFRMHSDWKYFHRKKLNDPAQLDKNTGRYCDKKFHGLSDSQEIVHMI